jgi:hypothetical protein
MTRHAVYEARWPNQDSVVCSWHSFDGVSEYDTAKAKDLESRGFIVKVYNVESAQ